MLSNLTGPVDMPPSPLPFPVPRDFKWSMLNGPTGCYVDTKDPEYPNYDPEWYDCRVEANQTSSCAEPRKESPFLGFQWRPEPCLSLHFALIWWPLYEVWRTMEAVGTERGWEFTAYDNPQCEGEPLGVIEAGEESKGVCKAFDSWVAGVKIMPKWNWN